VSDNRSGQLSSEWLVMARSPHAFGPLTNDSRWAHPAITKVQVWTDDFSNILNALKIR